MTAENIDAAAEALRDGVIAEVGPKIMTATPALRDLAGSFVYGEIWSRPGLSSRERSIATIAAVVALNCEEETKLQALRGVSNGLTPAEISELLTQLVPYIGFPLVISAATRLAEYIEQLSTAESGEPR